MSEETFSLSLDEIIQPETADNDDANIGPMSMLSDNHDDGEVWMISELESV